MKNLIAPLAILFLYACAPQEEKTTMPSYTVDQFFDNISISGGSFSPDETKILVSSNETGIFNVFEIDLATGEKTQLTNSDEESYFADAYFPNSNRFIFSFDEGGNENYTVHMMNTNGQSKNLTPGEGARNAFLGWSRDKENMYLMSNKRDPRFMDVYKMAISELDKETPIGEMMYQNNDGLNAAAISANERYYVLSENISNAKNKLYLVNNETGERTDITPYEGDATYSPQYFSLDNQYLYYTTNEESDFSHLARRNIETGEVEKVFETDWDVQYAYVSWNEKYRVIGINEDAKTTVIITNQETGEEVSLPEIPDGSISGVNISESETKALLTVSTSSAPSDKYLYDFETGDLKRLTNTLNPEINAEHLVEGKVVRYPSFDGLEIPAIYYQPKQASASNKVPALVLVHGGPGGQSRLGFNPMVQYYVNHGYAVIAVNNRGSSGYGKEFFHMDDKNHGDKDLKDCIAAKDFLIGTGVVDPDKIGIMGGSYGGYMVMAALAFAPEEFEVGVNIFGVTNWLRTLKSIPPYWEAQRKALYDELGDPFTEDSVRLYEISPLFHAANVTKPLMVLQGANDVRVLQVESDEIVAGVRANGVPVEYMIFEDEGHGFLKKENQLEGYGKVKDFLDEHLKGTDE